MIVLGHAPGPRDPRRPQRPRTDQRVPRGAGTAGLPPRPTASPPACWAVARGCSLRRSAASPASTCSTNCRPSSAPSGGCWRASTSRSWPSPACCAIRGSAFLVVTTPEREPAREARIFASHLDRAGIARAGLIVNRVHADGLGGVPLDRARARLAQRLDERLARRVARNLADFDALATRDRASVAELGDALRETAPILVAELESEVQDLAGLARVATRLFA